MELEVLKKVLLWCVAINYGVLLVWFFAFVFAKNLMYSIHSKWFLLSKEEFNKTHYKGMAYYKIGIILFYLTPYLALAIAG